MTRRAHFRAVKAAAQQLSDQVATLLNAGFAEPP